MLSVAIVDPTHPAAVGILETHLGHSRAHCPTTSQHSFSAQALADKGVVIVIAQKDGETVGVGGLMERSEDARAYGEIKSMHTLPTARGLGVGQAVLCELIALAARRAYPLLRLETGSEPVYAPARRLYERNGFVDRPPFADYGPDPLSVFMERPAGP